MDKNQCWLIYYKANIAENSSLNMDGSTYVFGIAAVPTKDLKKALELFDYRLQESAQQLIEIYKCTFDQNLSAPHEADLFEGIQSSLDIATSSQKVYLSIIGNESLG
ncbi:MAG: hypothetical protein B0W54_02090 [Cellvibrio sp. 79]|nr:MAG: hypothetical protein B0W54_02090 [Cellvibrio sp. 79]